MTTVLAPDTAATFVDRFAAGWAAPHRGAWDDLFAPDVVLRQPLAPDAHGLDGAHGFFDGIDALFDDLRGEVVAWAAAEDDDVLFIELALSGRLSGREVRWTTVDRIRLDAGGRIAERVASFDPTPVVRAVLTTPRAWPRFVRAQLAARRRSA